jgi:hypothetical protein
MKKYEDYTYRERRNALEDDEQYRTWIHKKLLAHLREGLSAQCFGIIDKTTMAEAIKNHPESFDLREIEHAIDEGQAMWEKLGHAQANGKNLGNSRTWYYNMSNRYGWSERSKQEIDSKQAVTVSVVSYKDTLTT